MSAVVAPSRCSPLCPPSTSGRQCWPRHAWQGRTCARVIRSCDGSRCELGPSRVLFRGAHQPDGGAMARRACVQRRAACVERRRIHAAAGANFRQADEEYMKEYQALKDGLFDSTRKCGGAVAAYLLVTVDGEAALCALLGTAASCLYLAWLYRDVDSYTADTVVPMAEAEKMENVWARRAAKVLAAYPQALRPRLLVPVGLAAGSAAVNAALGPGAGFDLLHQGCLLGGFLAYKIALLIKVIDELTPKEYNEGASSRPTIERIEDELDRWGRPKRPMVRLPTEALPEGVEPEKMPLAGLILAGEEAPPATAQQPQRPPGPKLGKGGSS